MAIFSTRIKIEKSPNNTINKKVLLTNEIPIKDTEKSKKDPINGSLLSNLETNHPEATVPNKALIGITNNIDPNWASFKLNRSLIVGILDAQDEKHNPDKKK
jgi:hypothetical protein